jgi:hypothetical protein
MEDPRELSFWLMPSPEEYWKTESYQLELRQFGRDVASKGLTITPAFKRLKTIEDKIDYEIRCEKLLTGDRPHSSGYLEQTPPSGEFVIEIVKTLGSLGLGGIIGAWIQAKHGRKVRVKVGEIEAEASTTEEVEKLLVRAQEIQQRNQPKVIHEP